MTSNNLSAAQEAAIAATKKALNEKSKDNKKKFDPVEKGAFKVEKKESQLDEIVPPPVAIPKPVDLPPLAAVAAVGEPVAVEPDEPYIPEPLDDGPELFGATEGFDPKLETLERFQIRIRQAQMNKTEWIETSRKVVEYFTKKKGTESMVYEGVRVFVVGKRDDIVRFESMSIDQRMQEENRLARGVR